MVSIVQDCIINIINLFFFEIKLDLLPSIVFRERASFGFQGASNK